MKNIDLIRKLILLPLDAEVEVRRSGQARVMEVHAVFDPSITGAARREAPPGVLLLVDWK